MKRKKKGGGGGSFSYAEVAELEILGSLDSLIKCLMLYISFKWSYIITGQLFMI